MFPFLPTAKTCGPTGHKPTHLPLPTPKEGQFCYLSLWWWILRKRAWHLPVVRRDTTNLLAVMLIIENRYDHWQLQNWKWREQAGQKTFQHHLAGTSSLYSSVISGVYQSFSFGYLELPQLRTPRFNTNSLLGPSISPQSSFTRYTERYTVSSLTHSQHYMTAKQ